MSDAPGKLGLEEVVIERGAVREAARYLKNKGSRQVIIVADANTYEAAGKSLEGHLMEASIKTGLCMMEPGAAGDVVADAESVLRLLVQVEVLTDAIVAVGSGTIHDIVRFVCSRSGKLFVSVPTAASVDGYASSGAPLIMNGRKVTVPAAAPAAIFADLDVLMRAPHSLAAAGFADMLGKLTSLFDWKFSHLAGGEPYDEHIAAMTENALLSCITHVDEIGQNSETGITVLMSSLIESGKAILRFGQSHPASGAEHHLSHYWEMEYLRTGKRALLHGAKVGVACAEISRLYHEAVNEGVFPGKEPEAMKLHGEKLREWLKKVPSPDEIRSLLRRAGSSWNPEQLGIDNELMQRSLREAHHVRARYTLLKAMNEAH